MAKRKDETAAVEEPKIEVKPKGKDIEAKPKGKQTFTVLDSNGKAVREVADREEAERRAYGSSVR